MTSKDDGKPPVPPDVQRQIKVLADGTVRVYHYHRETRAKIPGEPGSVEFEIALRDARNPRPVILPRAMFADLLDGFLASPEHLKRGKPTTRRAREYYVELMRTRFDYLTQGDLRVRSVRTDFYDWRDEMQATPRKAEAAIKTLRHVLQWAYKRAMIDVNHATEIESLVPKGHNRAKIVWTAELERAFLDAAGPAMREFFLMASYTALRQADLIRLRWSDLDDGGWITIVPSKTAERDVTVWLPTFAYPPLAELVAGLSRCTDRMLTTDGGSPWSTPHFGKLFQEAKRAAGLDKTDIHFHDLRGTAINRLYDAGCTDAEVASVSGHTIGGGSALADYANRSRQLSLNAFKKLAAATHGGPKVVPFKKAGSGGFV